MKINNTPLEPAEIKELDYSNELEKQFIEVGPYTKDEETGEVINNTDHKILIEIEPINIKDKINSYYNETSLYKIIENGILEAKLNEQEPTYADISTIPNNRNDLQDYLNEKNSEFEKLDDNLKQALFNDESIQNYINNKIEEMTKTEEKEQTPNEQQDNK